MVPNRNEDGHRVCPARHGMLTHHLTHPEGEAVAEGSVIIIGGAEDKVRDRVILNRFASLAGGRDATVAVISTASSLGAEAGERYRHVFADLGIERVRPLHAITRSQANDESAARVVKDATGIFLTGGNQLRLSSTIGGTRLADAILERFRNGAVIAGTSAGASAMSSHMIAFGASGATPKHRMAQIAAGLGVLPGVIVDQHFQQRNRLGRLLSLIAQNPSLLGLGVDEDTAGVVGPDHVMEVIGRGSITVVDGAGSETDAWEIHGHRPLMISGVVLHSLPAATASTCAAASGSRRPPSTHCPAARPHRADRRTDRQLGEARGQDAARRQEEVRPRLERRQAAPASLRCVRGGSPGTDPAHRRDAHPARAELLGARAGRPDARRSRRARAVPRRTRSRTSPTRSSS